MSSSCRIPRCSQACQVTVSPACPRSSPGSPLGGSCLEHLQEPSRVHPLQSPKWQPVFFPETYGWTTYGTTTTWLLAQKSSSKMLLRFRSERLFLPNTPLRYHCCCPNEPKASQQNDGGWLPAPSRCLRIGRGRCAAGGPVSRERPTWRDTTLSFTGENLGQVQSGRECSLSQEAGSQSPECAWRGARLSLASIAQPPTQAQYSMQNIFLRDAEHYSQLSHPTYSSKYNIAWLLSVCRSLYLWHKSQYKKL